MADLRFKRQKWLPWEPTKGKKNHCKIGWKCKQNRMHRLLPVNQGQELSSPQRQQEPNKGFSFSIPG